MIVALRNLFLAWREIPAVNLAIALSKRMHHAGQFAMLYVKGLGQLSRLHIL